MQTVVAINSNTLLAGIKGNPVLTKIDRSKNLTTNFFDYGEYDGNYHSIKRIYDANLSNSSIIIVKDSSSVTFLNIETFEQEKVACKHNYASNPSSLEFTKEDS